MYERALEYYKCSLVYATTNMEICSCYIRISESLLALNRKEEALKYANIAGQCTLHAIDEKLTKTYEGLIDDINNGLKNGFHKAKNTITNWFK